MADEIQMVVVDGVRYHPDDAPKKASKAEPEKKAATAKNKARSASNKEG